MFIYVGFKLFNSILVLRCFYFFIFHYLKNGTILRGYKNKLFPNFFPEIFLSFSWYKNVTFSFMYQFFFLFKLLYYKMTMFVRSQTSLPVTSIDGRHYCEVYRNILSKYLRLIRQQKYVI